MIDLSVQKPIYTRTSPCLTKIKERVLLNSPSSTKRTYHISLNIQATGLQFHPGDSLGILPQNDPKAVTELLSLLKIRAEESVIDPKSQTPLTALEYLSSKVNLSRISSSLLRYIQTRTQDPIQRDQLSFFLAPENKHHLQEFLHGKDLLDIFALFSSPCFSLSDLSEHLSPLLPRFYSISSSLKAHEEEVHILVALSSHLHRNEVQYGVASHFLCHLAIEGSTHVPLYVQPTQHFRIPTEPNKDLIMVGPGTGVAPYRAFLQERKLQENGGQNWLFFGGRNRHSDFFYEEFLLSLQKEGKLKVSTAFSRDQEEKQYVQHRLWDERKEIWRWLESEALFYVCGDASKMAKDVESTLLKIIQIEGNLSDEETKQYFKRLKLSKRYLSDVY